MARVFLIFTLLSAFACGDDSTAGDTGTGRDERVRDEGMTECEDDERLCMVLGSLRCTPVLRNPLNCGGCGQQCETNETCDQARCRPATECARGETDCGELGCVNTRTTEAACGSCLIQCDEDETCTRGSCTPAECDPASETPDRCNDVCVNTQNDRANCGTCGNACDEGERCIDSRCEDSCGGTVCESGGAPECVDTETDRNNCGDCGRACGTGLECVDSDCECVEGTLCGGICTDTDVDPNHCSACDAPCEVGQTCERARCVCPTGTEPCRGACVNTQTDRAHCNGCNMACEIGESCVSGRCVSSACPVPGEVECGSSCTNLNTDRTNCGICGNGCSRSETCEQGACRPLNDMRESADTIELPVNGSELTIRGSTTSATADIPEGLACNANGPNVWFRVFVPERGGALWVDSASSSYDTALFLTDSTGRPVDGFCNDDCPCGEGGDFTSRLQSCMTGALLREGTYFISVGGFSSVATGDFTLHIQFLPASNASFFYGPRLDGMGVTSGTRLIAPNERQSATSCGGNQTSRSGEDMRWVAACGTGRDHSFSVCPRDGGSWLNDDEDGDDYDPVMYRISAQTGLQENCNDFTFNLFANCRPTGGGPNSGASMRDDDELERGVHGIIIDSAGEAGSGMFYELAYEVPTLEFD